MTVRSCVVCDWLFVLPFARSLMSDDSVVSACVVASSSLEEPPETVLVPPVTVSRMWLSRVFMAQGNEHSPCHPDLDAVSCSCGSFSCRPTNASLSGRGYG